MSIVRRYRNSADNPGATRLRCPVASSQSCSQLALRVFVTLWFAVLTLLIARAADAQEPPTGMVVGEESRLRYSVSVASYASLDAALAGQQALVRDDLPVYVAPVAVNGNVRYRLLAGLLPSRSQAEELMNQLVADGKKKSASSWDIRPTHIAFFFGAFDLAYDAEAAVHELGLKRIPAYVVPAASLNGGLDFRAYAGGYMSAVEAGEMQKMISMAGVNASLVERVGLEHEAAVAAAAAMAEAAPVIEPTVAMNEPEPLEPQPVEPQEELPPTQAEQGSGFSVEMVAFGGAAFAAADLSGAFVIGGNAGFNRALIENGFIFGGSLGLRYGRVELEAMGAFWPTKQTTFLTLQNAPNDFASFQSRTNVLILGGSLLFNFPLSNSLIEPFLAGGLGVKSYTTEKPFGGTLFVDSTDFMWNLGAGARFPVSRVSSMRIELRDYMSYFDFQVSGAGQKLQHDVVATLGLSLVFGGQ